MKTAFLGALCILLLPGHIQAYDRFSEERIPTHFAIESPQGLHLVIKSQIALAWRDIQGRGGPGFDSSTDTVTLGTRSAHVALETARFALRARISDGLSVYSAYRFDERGGALDSVWLDYEWARGVWSLQGELGMNQPWVARDQFMLRRSIAERVYWGSSEAHAVATAVHRAPSLTTAFGLSAAFMRPLGASPINDASGGRGTIAVLSYDHHRPLSGGHPVVGAKASVNAYGVTASTFGFLGRMSAEGGIDEIRNRLAGFAVLPGYRPEDPRDQSDTFWWSGLRLGAHHRGFEFDADLIWSAESLLRRSVWSLQSGYVWDLGTRAPDQSLALRGRWERYDILAGGTVMGFRSPDPSQALTWDHDVATLSVEWTLYQGIVRLRGEHSVIREETAHPAASGAPVTVDNNETMIGLDIRL